MKKQRMKRVFRHGFLAATMLCVMGMLFVSGIAPLHAQTHAVSSEREEVRQFLNRVTHEDIYAYLGEPASKLYARIEKSPYKIRHMSTMSESRRASPDGIERMYGVILYNKTRDEMLKRQKVFIVYISLDVWIDDCLFWNNLPVDNWMEGIREHTKDMRVMDIRFEERTI